MGVDGGGFEEAQSSLGNDMSLGMEFDIDENAEAELAAQARCFWNPIVVVLILRRTIFNLTDDPAFNCIDRK